MNVPPPAPTLPSLSSLPPDLEEASLTTHQLRVELFSARRDLELAKSVIEHLQLEVQFARREARGRAR